MILLRFLIFVIIRQKQKQNQKLVELLNKLDPDNKMWKQEQLKKIDALDLPLEAKQGLKQKLEEDFKEGADYARKLFLIRDCIYGVDIQSIAIQIARLRFFISLLIEMEKKRDKKEA